LAQRLQRVLRNKDGKSYTVSEYQFFNRHAGVASVRFDGLHKDFANNLKKVEEQIAKDIQKMDNQVIKEAISSYQKQKFEAVEHDSDTLMSLIDTVQFIQEELNSTKRPFQIFQTITPQIYQDTITSVFKPQNRYKVLYRDYYFFSMDLLVISIVFIIIFILIYLNIYKYDFKKYNIQYTKRDILFQRRISSRLMGFLYLVITYIITVELFEWIKYIIFRYIIRDVNYLYTIDMPYSYLLYVLDIIIFIILFFFIYRLFWRYYAVMDVIEDGIIFTGNRAFYLPRSSIDSISIEPRSMAKWSQIFGNSFRFWKPLVKIFLKDGNSIYIRSSNAQHLSEDLQKWLNK